MPMPAGTPSNHRRSRRASSFAKRAASSPETIRDWAIRQACSVSSENIPRLGSNRYCVGGPSKRRARRGESPSYGKPRASPTAVPSKHPTRARCNAAIFLRLSHRCFPASTVSVQGRTMRRARRAKSAGQVSPAGPRSEPRGLIPPPNPRRMRREVLAGRRGADLPQVVPCR